MRKLLSQARKLNLLYVLELLDQEVRETPLAASYIGSTTQLAVAEVLQRARKKRDRPKANQPQQEQRPMQDLIPC